MVTGQQTIVNGGKEAASKREIHPIRKIRAVIFDLDGTLLDTSEGIIRSVRYMIDKLGYAPVAEDQYRTFIGPPIHHRMKQVYGIGEDEAKIAMHTFRDHYLEHDIFLAAHYPGMEELLTQLAEDGYLLGVCTYKREDQAKALLEEKGLAGHFRVIHGQDREGRMSKAEVLDLTMKDMGVTPEQSVMVGDAYTDAEGAAGAGVAFLGVTYGFGFDSGEDVAKYPYVGVADRPEEIARVLQGLESSSEMEQENLRNDFPAKG